MSNRQEVMGREVAQAPFAKQIRSTKPVGPTDLPPVSAAAVYSPKATGDRPRVKILVCVHPLFTFASIE
jgi:hypothetical protein